MKLCGERDLAEELVQETFCQAVRCAGKYNETCSVLTWLCGIAKNLWMQELRRRKKNAHISFDNAMVNDVGSDVNKVSKSVSPNLSGIAESAEDICLRSMKVFDVLQQIHNLPEHEKEVVLLRSMGGFTFREIGQITGKSENWARVTYFRAKKKIKED